MISNRVILVVSGMILAYLAVFFGEGVGGLSSIGGDTPLNFVPIAALAINAFGGFALLYRAVMQLSTRKAKMRDILETTSCLLLLSYTFGALATPFATFGATPWSWHSMWAWIPIAGLIPTVIAVKDITIDALYAKKRQKNRPKASVRVIGTSKTA